MWETNRPPYYRQPDALILGSGGNGWFEGHSGQLGPVMNGAGGHRLLAEQGLPQLERGWRHCTGAAAGHAGAVATLGTTTVLVLVVSGGRPGGLQWQRLGRHSDCNACCIAPLRVCLVSGNRVVTTRLRVTGWRSGGRHWIGLRCPCRSHQQPTGQHAAQQPDQVTGWMTVPQSGHKATQPNNREQQAYSIPGRGKTPAPGGGGS